MTAAKPTTVLVRVNIAALRQPFRPCDPDFIRDVCHAKCCRSSVDPTGIAVVVTKREAMNLRRLGATVDPDSGRVAPVDRRCPFQDGETHLCTIHGTDEPSGCIVSPFTVNATNTLIVRNRYRMLPCFKAAGAIPVAEAHRASLELLFGTDATAAIVSLVRGTGDDSFVLPVPRHLIDMLHHKNTASKAGT